jgi:hypothetical protein
MPDLPGALTIFSSNTQDPNWDRARKLRARPYQQRMDAWRRAVRNWKKSGPFGLGGFSWQRPPRPPAPPPELAPYVKSVTIGSLRKSGVFAVGLAKRVKGKPLRAIKSVRIGRLAKFFDESKIRRDKYGRFAPKDGSKIAAGAPRPRYVSSIYARGPNWEDREEKPPYDWSRAVGRPKEVKRMPYTLREAYERYRKQLDANPPEPPKAPERKPTKAFDSPHVRTGGMFYEWTSIKPQIPSGMSVDQYIALSRWAGDRTRSMRDEIITRSIGRRDPGGHKNRILLPIGTNPKDRNVRLAFNLARNLALHDVGLISYDYKMKPDIIQALQPYKDFIKHARRRMANTLREEAEPGTWAPFRREFGTPFKDGRTYHADTRSGHKKGEPKKAFARHMHFLKAFMPLGLAKAV